MISRMNFDGGHARHAAFFANVRRHASSAITAHAPGFLRDLGLLGVGNILITRLEHLGKPTFTRHSSGSIGPIAAAFTFLASISLLLSKSFFLKLRAFRN